MASKVEIEWRVYNRSTNEKVEGVSLTSMVNSYDEIQPKMLDKLSANYNAKELDKDLKIGDKLRSDKDRGGYFITEFMDDEKEHDIVIICSVINH